MRVYRLIEYDGDEEWIMASLRRSITTLETPKGIITAAVVHIEHDTQPSDLMIEIMDVKTRAGIPVEGY